MSNFAELDLSSVDIQGSSILSPGQYEASIKSAAMQPTKNGKGSMLVVEYTVPTEGEIKDWMVLFHESDQTARIAREKLKTMLTHAGHPNPDKPGDVSSLKGLKVGINVVEGDKWTDDQGNVRDGGSKLKRSGAYFSLSSSAPATPEAKTDLNDEIPF
ncbi:MAG: DUF669 domain-containing protein [Alphaproteobacteria bacterium]|nr:DUF669 domain-containing protein [Alphaproteobacteria bacterium]